MDHFPKISTQELMRWLRSERASETYASTRFSYTDLSSVRARIARLKETLATREHLPNKPERKRIRQEAARAKTRAR
jgi:hypothetical protein